MSTNIKKSAAVIIVNAAKGRVLLGRRCDGSSFMPNAFVFPGGIVEPSDADLPTSMTNSIDADSSSNKKTSKNANSFPGDFAIRIAAIRELFEECALLPVVNTINKQRCVLSAHSNPLLREWHLALVGGQRSLLELMMNSQPNNQHQQWQLNVSALEPLSNWLTPYGSPKRFDTYFFVMAVDECARIESASTELDQLDWYRPEELLRRAHRDEITVAPPQAYELTRLVRNRFMNLHRLRNDTKICPQQLDSGDEIIALLNGDYAYAEGPNSTQTPIRKVCAEDLKYSSAGDKRKRIHRVVYKKTPPFGQMRIFL